jgi:hypothetical protein
MSKIKNMINITKVKCKKTWFSASKIRHRCVKRTWFVLWKINALFPTSWNFSFQTIEDPLKVYFRKTQRQIFCVSSWMSMRAVSQRREASINWRTKCCSVLQKLNKPGNSPSFMEPKDSFSCIQASALWDALNEMSRRGMDWERWTDSLVSL